MSFVRFQETGETWDVGKIVCVGRNYEDHIDEMGDPTGDEPVAFLKPSTAVIRDGDAIRIPEGVGEVHHEVELAAVVGETATEVPREDALDHVGGWCVLLDMTAREMQRRAKEAQASWDISKGMDTFAPVSDVAPAEAVDDPRELRLVCRNDGEVVQDAPTKAMRYGVEDLIEYVSQYMTLERGDILATGTPEGVGPVEPGTTVEGEIPGVASLEVGVEMR